MGDIISSHEGSQQVGDSTSFSTVRTEQEGVHTPLPENEKAALMPRSVDASSIIKGRSNQTDPEASHYTENQHTCVIQSTVIFEYIIRRWANNEQDIILLLKFALVGLCHILGPYTVCFCCILKDVNKRATQKM